MAARLFRLPPTSLRSRLALWYLLVLGVILTLFAGGIYLDVGSSLLSGVDTALQARLDTVTSQIQVGASGPRYEGGDSPHANAETAVYLLDTRGRLLEAIAGSRELTPHPPLVARALTGRTSVPPTTVGNQRIDTAPLYDDRGSIVGVVQVIQSLDVVDDQLQQLLTVLLLATPFLLAVATVGGVFLAGRALAPIDRITATAGAIGAGNLAGRLSLAPRDDEVGRLAATLDGMLERLEHAFVQQEQAAARQRQFAADASHELRTPLTIIKGDLDVLLRRRRTPEEYEEVVRGVDEETGRLSSLVEDLLTLARADSGQAELAREFVYLDALVDAVIASLGRLASVKGVVLRPRLQRDVAVIGDPARLRQLVFNVLGNAVRYTLTGGAIEVVLRGQDGEARLTIVDTGIGIAPDDLPHIFDRFYRADRARTHVEGGTGLGLAIARWSAEAHGGHLEASSRLEEGSTFTLTMPLAPVDDAPSDDLPRDARDRTGRQPDSRLKTV